MRLKFSPIAVILFTFQLCLLFVNGNVFGLHMCLKNNTVAIQVLASTSENMTCQCQAAPVTDPNFRDDYTYVPGMGAYKLHTLAKSWNDARKICNQENAHLAIINSKDEEKVLLDIFKNESANIHGGATSEQAYLGVHDLYQEGEWVTIFGESLYSTGYAEWSSHCWGAQPDNWNNNQNCATLILKCGSMDDVNCSTRLAFFCEKPEPCAVQASFGMASEANSQAMSTESPLILPEDVRILTKSTLPLPV